MSKIAIVPFFRASSGRLPNKVLYDLGGKPAFIHAIERVTSVVDPDYLLIACDEDARDDPIALLAKQYGYDCFRGAEDSRRRVRAAGNKLGLKDDDMILRPGGDTPFGIYKHLPYLIDQMNKCGAELSFLEMPKGSLVEGVNIMANVHLFGPQAKFDENVHIAEGMHFEFHPFYSRDCRKIIYLKSPPEYLAPWPWGLLYIDWPVQALVIKEIYRQLYKGSPIDELDVYRLMQQQPYLANMIPLELRTRWGRGDGPAPGRTTRALFLEEFELLGGEVIELTWGGDVMR